MANTDALPPDWNYPDKGCRYAPSCLSCPLPACRFDADNRRGHPGCGRKRPASWPLIAAANAAGEPVAAIAERFGVSPRHVRHIAAVTRQERGES